MVIDLSKIDTEQFMVHNHILNGEVVHLIQPQHIACKFTQQNKIFRSSLWSNNGFLISAGLPKFCNFGENPDNFPTPESLDGCVCVEKLDGSLISCTKYKGNYIIRTRGTVDASKLENGYEIDIFKDTILSKLSNIHLISSGETWDYSFLFEWQSPVNRVVIKVNEPQFKLIGIVNHSDYSLIDQLTLDNLGWEHGLQRPETYSFDSLNDIVMLIKKWEGKEGIVIYSNGGQTLHKIKSDWYLVRHRLKEEFSSMEKILDFFIQQNRPSFDAFQKQIAEVTDWETANECIGDISKICDANKKVNDILNGMYYFVETNLRPLGDHSDKKVRALMAKKVIESYGNTNRSSFIFKLLDCKELDKDDIKKLFFQCLKQ